MSSLTASLENVGLITYVSRKGTSTHFAAKHIVSCTELPDNTISVITTGGSQRLKFDNSTDRDAAMTVLDEALAG